MRFPAGTIAAFFLFAFSAIPAAGFSDVSGHWSWSITLPNGVVLPAELQLKAEGNQVTGTAQVYDPDPTVPLQNGKLEANKLSFAVPVPTGEMGDATELLKFDLVFEDGALRGQLLDPKGTNQGTVLLRLAKQPFPEKLSPYLFVWAGSVDHQKADFLAVIDTLPQSKSYGRVVATLPVDVHHGHAHHTEHQMTSASTLFANLFTANRSYLFDLHDPLSPKLLTSFGSFGTYSHSHSFRLARHSPGTPSTPSNLPGQCQLLCNLDREQCNVIYPSCRRPWARSASTRARI